MIDRKICESAKLAKLKYDASRLLYVYLIIWADVDGRITADPDLIKGWIFPKLKSWNVAKIKKHLQDLIDEKLIDYYQVKNGDKFIQIRRFRDFQWTTKEAKSVIPGVDAKDSKRLKVITINSQEVPGNPVARAEDEDEVEDEVEEEEEVKDYCTTLENVDIFLTKLLIDLMRENLPKSHIVKRFMESETIQADWINQCRLMRERDDRTAIEIETLIRWSQKDGFWRSNILSMSKLRKQFDRLLLQAKKTDYAGIREWLRERESER